MKGNVREFGFCLTISIHTVGAKLGEVLQKLFRIVTLVDNLGAQVLLLFLCAHCISYNIRRSEASTKGLKDGTIFQQISMSPIASLRILYLMNNYGGG